MKRRAAGRMMSDVRRRLLLMAVLYVSSLLYMLFQGGKTSVMLFCIFNGLIVYLTLGYWSGIRRITGTRKIGIHVPGLTAASGTDSRVIAAGATLQAQLELRLPGYYPVPYVLVQERLERNGAEWLPFEASFVPNLKREGSAEYATPPLQRGVYRFLPTMCMTRDIFGFFEHTGSFHEPGEFSVRPQTISLQGWDRIRKGAKGHFSHAAAPRSSRETTQINGIREFLPGDRLSRVHWGATAKTGQWKSKEFEREALPRTIVLLDAYRRGDAGAEERFETAVSAAASLFEHGMKRGTSMGLWCTSSVPLALKARSGGDQLHRAIEMLTEVDSDGTDKLAQAVMRADPILETGSMALLVTDAPLEEIRQAMGWLSRRSLNPVCIRIMTADQPSSMDNDYFAAGPVYSIRNLEELPAALEGREAAVDAGS
ncbi:DUF58 domain-containing protein [Paenibacillus pasadenensis]|uniref:DUF58 domain-containing protein n=1 Tax=Paenibacillus pasadenensis TaxID=217090 RepID=UPI002040D975|nr:DUF58 domain-containing protein [Paenibacillus pasadenensis]MCM3746482.1 DUF58 domain-containing protein [Paenibacillus pasadenensis]